MSLRGQLDMVQASGEGHIPLTFLDIFDKPTLLKTGHVYRSHEWKSVLTKIISL
jgi:hypothetical protein